MMTTLKKDLVHLIKLAVFGLRRWNGDWMMIWVAWAAAVWDAVVVMDAGTTAPM